MPEIFLTGIALGALAALVLASIGKPEDLTKRIDNRPHGNGADGLNYQLHTKKGRTS